MCLRSSCEEDHPQKGTWMLYRGRLQCLLGWLVRSSFVLLVWICSHIAVNHSKPSSWCLNQSKLLFFHFERRFRNRVPPEFVLRRTPWESKALRGEYFRQFRKENHTCGHGKAPQRISKLWKQKLRKEKLSGKKNSEQEVGAHVLLTFAIGMVRAGIYLEEDEGSGVQWSRESRWYGLASWPENFRVICIALLHAWYMLKWTWMYMAFLDWYGNYSSCWSCRSRTLWGCKKDTCRSTDVDSGPPWILPLENGRVDQTVNWKCACMIIIVAKKRAF